MESLKSAILKSIYFSSIQSIAEISESVGKSIPLTTKAVQELLEDKMIVESGLRASTGGRRAMNFTLNNSKLGALISVAIDQHYLYATAVDLSNEVLVGTKSVEIHLLEQKDVFECIKSLIYAVIEDLKGRSVLSIGVTMPGFVNRNEGINHSFDEDNSLYKIKSSLENEFSIAVFIENDSSAIAIAEQHFGLARGVNDVLVLNLNWGVGLGMVMQGNLFRGHSGNAGEFSHIPLANESKLCSCGKKGCLEVEASLLCAMEEIHCALESGERSSLEEVYAREGNVRFEQVLAAYEKGDQLTIRAVKNIAHMLGKGIATLIHILNPEKIIISGRGAAFGEALVPQIQSAVQEYCIPRLSKQTTIQISEINDVQLLASACIAVQQMSWSKKRKTQLN
ncbi:ROK family protein [Sphingobacterium sp. LRF_L2]|uniref:ROK family protein n=1 Tax=Sphingobacterium sp. LRF_L2 TaxID=3369421 RepID=UPI003F62005D